MRALFRQQRRNRRRWGLGQRDLDKDQRLVDQPGVEEGVASPVRRIDAPPEVVPVADLVHRLVADDLLEQRGRRGPVDAAQHQKPAIEPRTEQMEKIAIDNRQRRVLVHQRQEVGAHLDQRRGAARRAIEPAEQLVAARLGGVVDFARGGLVGLGAEIGDRRHHPLAVGPELVSKRAKERCVIGRIERSVAAQDLGGERDPRGLAPPGDQRPAGTR